MNATQTNKSVAIPEYYPIPVSKEESKSLIRWAANSYWLFSSWSTTSILHQQRKKTRFADVTADAIVADDDIDIDIDSKVLPKAWLRVRGISIKQSRRFGTWTYSFRPICVVPDTSPIFEACKNGDVGEVIRLVQSGMASVFDTSQEGYNLLHVAAGHLRADLCRWLLAQGVQGSEFDTRRRLTALHIASRVSDMDDAMFSYFSTLPQLQSFNNAGHYSDALNTIRVLIEVGQCDPMQAEIFGDTSLHLYRGGAEPLNYMLNQENFLVSVDPQGPRDEHVLEVHISTGSSISDTLVKYMMEKSIKFSESRRLKDGFPDWPIGLHMMLQLLTSEYGRAGTCTSTATVSFISALLEMGADIHHKHEFFGSPLSCLIESNLGRPTPLSLPVITETMPLQIMTWFELLTKADYDLQGYIFQEWKYYQRCIIDPVGYCGVCYMHVFHARNIGNIICKFEWYDYRRQYRNINLSQTRQEQRMPGAWEDGDYEEDWIEDPMDFQYNEATILKIQRPRRSPDFEM
ncbi:hypothetical protein OCU04_004042 [Sclerotinia nivalis]|nr:hypothetical protein OCU04_004042 [Sclerotinia nivalis]